MYCWGLSCGFSMAQMANRHTWLVIEGVRVRRAGACTKQEPYILVTGVCARFALLQNKTNRRTSVACPVLWARQGCPDLQRHR